jgi:hypothetical protein
MDPPMREAYRELEDEIRKALKAHRGNRSVLSIMLNTLLGLSGSPLWHRNSLRHRVRF